MKLEEFSQDDFERASRRLFRSLTRGKNNVVSAQGYFALRTEWCW